MEEIWYGVFQSLENYLLIESFCFVHIVDFYILQECTFQPAFVSERLAGQGRALKLAGTLAHYPAPANYPDSPQSNKYLVSHLHHCSALLLLRPPDVWFCQMYGSARCVGLPEPMICQLLKLPAQHSARTVFCQL